MNDNDEIKFLAFDVADLISKSIIFAINNRVISKEQGFELLQIFIYKIAEMKAVK
ncbi:MAG: hypothetical protein QW530_00890 [Candidatus Micrarchaeaceae archaeon]